jgi:hypothetical protein
MMVEHWQAAHFYSSPYFVVPVLAITFLVCILYGTLGGRETFDEHPPDPSSPGPNSH